MHAAAWVQAVGSVLAILVAVAIPAWQRHTARSDRQKEQLLQARSLLFGVSAELVEIEAAHQNAERIFAQAQGMGQGSGRAVRDFIGQANIAVPPMLLAGMDRFYLLGEPAGITLPQLVTVTLQYERKLAQIINAIYPRPVEHPRYHHRQEGRFPVARRHLGRRHHITRAANVDRPGRPRRV